MPVDCARDAMILGSAIYFSLSTPSSIVSIVEKFLYKTEMRNVVE